MKWRHRLSAGIATTAQLVDTVAQAWFCGGSHTGVYSDRSLNVTYFT